MNWSEGYVLRCSGFVSWCVGEKLVKKVTKGKRRVVHQLSVIYIMIEQMTEVKGL
jgi:hypothetical protein